MTVKARSQTVYDPYGVIITGYDIINADDHAIKSAIYKLDLENPAIEEIDAKRMIAFLMANTKRRKEHAVSEKLLMSGLTLIARQYPRRIVEHVVGNWYKRPGDDAIFTPSQAEFYRAIKDAGEPWRILRNELLNLRDKTKTGGIFIK